MNTLTINEETRNIQFTYEAETFNYKGKCSLDELNAIKSVNVEITTKENKVIGNCSTDRNLYINIWEAEHQDKIDIIATEFKALQLELKNHYTVK